MKEKINQVLLLLFIMAVATGTTAVINFIQGNELQGVSDVLMLCSFFILAWVLIRQKFCLDVLKVVGKSHFDLVEVLKKGIKKDDNDDEPAQGGNTGDNNGGNQQGGGSQDTGGELEP